MADLRDCLDVAVRDGHIDARRAADYQAAYDDLVDKRLGHMPLAAAQAEAKQILRESRRAQLAARRNAVLNQLDRNRGNGLGIVQSADPGGFLRDMFFYREGSPNKVFGVEAMQRGLRKEFLADMHKFLEQVGQNMFGRTRNRALLADFVRERFGEGTGSRAAKELAAAYDATAKRMRQLYNAHGGDIGERADWGLPHSHDAKRIRDAGFDVWRAAIFDQLDWERIIDHDTGRPFAPPGGRPDPVAADKLLKDIHEGFRTDHWDTRVPSGMPRGAALWRRRSDSRVLHFKTADGWLAYNERFGRTDPYTAIMHHIEGMARDIALMRVFGANPRAGLEFAIQTAERRANMEPDPKVREAMLERVKNSAEMARMTMDHMTGAANRPVNEKVAAIMGGARNLLTAAQLGRAVLSTATDLYTTRAAAQAMGMSGGGPLKRTIDLIFSHASREDAARMGYVFDGMSETARAHARFMQEGFAPAFTERVPAFVMRSTGMTFWTDLNRVGWQVATSDHLAKYAGKTMADMDDMLRTRLEARGITEDDWTIIGDPALVFQPRPGVTFIGPTTFRRNALAAGYDPGRVENLTLRLRQVVEEQLEFAIPSNSLEGRVSMIGSSRPGTFGGEVLRSSVMYRSYTLGLTINQYRRMMTRDTPLSRAGYLIKFAAFMTFFGAIGVQLKELAKGRDPRDMTEPLFWGEAFYQGGGLGIMGDLLRAETTRAGGGFSETAAGPAVGFLGDVWRVGAVNRARMAEGKDTQFLSDSVNVLARYNPLASHVVVGTAADRMLWDQLRIIIDPEAEREMGRMMRRQTNATGNAYWWEEGRVAPSRAPDLAAAAGGNAR